MRVSAMYHQSAVELVEDRPGANPKAGPGARSGGWDDSRRGSGESQGNSSGSGGPRSHAYANREADEHREWGRHRGALSRDGVELSASAVVLLVDDEPYVSEALKRALRHERYEFLTATSGAEAHNILKRE